MKIFFVSIFLTIIIGTENIYRKPLFDQSIIWIKNWRQSDSNSLDIFFKIITEFGSQYVLVPLFIIIFLCTPLNKSYCILNAVIYSIVFDCIMKICYGNPRPFWVENDLYKHCDTGYGNPSGHSFTSTAAYLSIWNVITDYEIFNKDFKGKFLKYFLLTFFLLLILTIMISRIYLALHSVNQIIYGSLLGLGIYLMIFHLVKIQKFNGKEFFEFILAHVKWGIWFICLISSSFFIWGFVKNSENSLWLKEIEKKCAEIKPYRLFNNDGLYGIMTISGILGAHLGLIILAKKTQKYYPTKEDEILNWYKSGNLKSHLLRIGYSFLLLLSLISFFIITSNELWIVYLLKMFLPLMITLFNLFFTLIYLSIIWGISNEKICISENTEKEMSPIDESEYNKIKK